MKCKINVCLFLGPLIDVCNYFTKWCETVLESYSYKSTGKLISVFYMTKTKNNIMIIISFLINLK